MQIIESAVLNTIFILFPNLIYIIYVANKQNLKESQNKIILDLNLFFTIILIITYNKNLLNHEIMIYFFLILLFSYLNQRSFASILISMILFEYLINNQDFNIIQALILLGGLFGIYKIFKERIKLLVLFIYVYIIGNLTVHTFIINNFYIKELLINTAIFFMVSYTCILYIEKTKEIIDLKNTINDFKKEKFIRESLFKITHEIKNPLAVVKGYLSMINVNDKVKTNKYVKIIKSETNRTINLLDDFSQFSKIKIECSRFNFSDLIYEVKNIVIPLFNSKNITYVFKCEKDLFINADINRLKQVIVNIIKNAVEACTCNDKISFTTYSECKVIIIIIKDNGCGMDKENLLKIYNPFYTTKENGTGLGVSLSKEIIESHKGKITYYSKLNKGTTVKIMIPTNC